MSLVDQLCVALGESLHALDREDWLALPDDVRWAALALYAEPARRARAAMDLTQLLRALGRPS